MTNQTAQTENPFTGFWHNKNYVWAGAMHLAWTELCESIVKEAIAMHTTDETVLSLIEAFNKPIFSKKDLAEDCYYVRSGFGNATVRQINQESKAKFPSKTLADLLEDLSESGVIAYAYFLKKFSYAVAFEKHDWFCFQEHQVKGFYAINSKQRDNIEILNYWDDDKFIVRLLSADQKDEIILCKGFDQDTPIEAYQNVLTYQNTHARLGEHDGFSMPEIHLNLHRKYTDLLGIPFKNKGFEGYFISAMFENIKLDIDYEGARAENEAVIVMSRGLGPRGLNLVLDEPFWLLMKQTNSDVPYVIVGVNNTEFMVK